MFWLRKCVKRMQQLMNNFILLLIFQNLTTRMLHDFFEKKNKKNVTRFA